MNTLPKYVSLKKAAKRARGAKKVLLTEHLAKQQVMSLDNEIVQLEKKKEEIQKQINKLRGKRLEIMEKFLGMMKHSY